MRLLTASVLASLSLVLAACGGKTTPEPEMPLVADPPMEAPPAPPPAAPPPAETAATPPPPPAEAPLTDEQIAAITTAVHTGEIDQAKLAQTRAKSPDVKKFAQTMVQHHGEANKSAEKILAKNNMRPGEHETAQKLAADSKMLLDSWKDLKGADFDKAYIDAQVKQHQDVLALMDTKLIPQAKNEELKKELTALRPKLQAHLTEAQTIQSKLKSAPGATPPGGTKTPPSGAPATPAPGTPGGSSSTGPAQGAPTAKK